MIVVDTSVLIDHLRGRVEAMQLLRDAIISGTSVTASVLTKVELLSGMRSDERHRTRALLGAIDWLPVSEVVAEAAGELARRYRRSHARIDVVDYVVAATVQSESADLWTLNVKHFPMIARLRPPY